MTVERLQEILAIQPFQPFVMHLADGRRVSVNHQEFIARAPSGRTIVVFQPDDSMHMIDLLLVTDIEIKRRRNGSRGRRPRA